MVLILSTDGDVSTCEVIEWLQYYNEKFIRINDNDIFNYEFKIYTENNSLKFTINKNGQIINSDDISIVWHRKFGFYAFVDEYPILKRTKNISLIQHFTSEYFSILGTILSVLKDKKWLLNLNQAVTNKFMVLAEAEKVGLKIPHSLILNNKEQLIRELNSRHTISKTIKDSSQINYNGKYLSMFTTEVIADEAITESLPLFFMPSLTQEKIEKEFELRIFFLENQFFTMAIFSQSDRQTQTDFRKYNFGKPNRTVPYKLPVSIEAKLFKLMKKLGLNTGSIDMIFTKDKEYVFLEVNPSGQFGMVSKPCNYPLEKIIAGHLIKNK